MMTVCTILIARGDLPLSIVMTVCTTLVAVLLTPLLTKILLGTYVPVDAVKLSICTLQVVVAPKRISILCKVSHTLCSTSCSVSFFTSCKQCVFRKCRAPKIINCQCLSFFRPRYLAAAVGGFREKNSEGQSLLRLECKILHWVLF